MSYSYRGNAKEATTLRVNESLTVSQLQEECKVRGVRGFSGKNKEWLQDELGYGTVWQAMQQKTSKAGVKKAAPNAPKTNAKAKKKVQAVKAKMRAAETKAVTPNVRSIQNLPKVSSSMTVPQLTHELLHRQPSIKGTSSKPKSWFLERLGNASIWSTSTAASTLDLGSLPVVSSRLTTSQLTHEILSRSGEYSKGLSGRLKADLLQLAGVGSIWTTGIEGATKLPAVKKKATNTSRAVKPKHSVNQYKRTAVDAPDKHESWLFDESDEESDEESDDNDYGYGVSHECKTESSDSEEASDASISRW